MNGVRTMPAPVAVVPVTDWRKSGTNEIAPNIAIPARKRVTTAATTMRLPKSRSGTIGSAARPGPGAPSFQNAEQEGRHARGEERHARVVHDGPAREARLLHERGGDQR